MDDLVSTAWLAERLGEPRLVVIDASSHLAEAGRNAREEFEYAHIPARAFSISRPSRTPTARFRQHCRRRRNSPRGWRRSVSATATGW
jgi:3-mercaptopyruvate sulfurtransferase SseA